MNNWSYQKGKVQRKVLAMTGWRQIKGLLRFDVMFDVLIRTN